VVTWQHGNARIFARNSIADVEYRPAAWDVSPLTSTARGAVGPRTPFSPERPVEMRNYVEDSLAYPEWDELVDQLVDTATMGPGIDDSSNRGSATGLMSFCLLVLVKQYTA